MADTLTQTVTTESFSQGGSATVLQVLLLSTLLTQGIIGPAGSGAMAPWYEDEFIVSGDQTTFTLSLEPANAVVSLYVNGLRQGVGNFTVVGTIVTVTGFVPTTGDTIHVAYQVGE